MVDFIWQRGYKVAPECFGLDEADSLERAGQFHHNGSLSVSAIADPLHSGQDALLVCLGRENPNRLAGLWWVMHHSDDPDREASVVTCYLDESATDGSTPIAVVGGLTLHKSHFLGLDEKWRTMLETFQLWPGLHMKDFGLHGRLRDFSIEQRRAVFSRAAAIIADHNICTIATTLDHSLYRSILAPTIKKAFSQYALCFIGCVVGQHQIAEEHKYQPRIAFLIDAGNPYIDHVRGAHEQLLEVQANGHFLHLGSLTQDKDDNISALQAADIIWWAVRRRATGYSFAGGFEPLETVLDARGHNQSPLPEVVMRELLERLEALNFTHSEEP